MPGGNDKDKLLDDGAVKPRLGETGGMCLSDALKSLAKDMPMLIAYEVYKAKITRAKYDALIAEKFTAKQAIELCKG